MCDRSERERNPSNFCSMYFQKSNGEHMKGKDGTVGFVWCRTRKLRRGTNDTRLRVVVTWGSRVGYLHGTGPTGGGGTNNRVSSEDLPS